MQKFLFEFGESSEYGPCQCCGDRSRLVAGLVWLDGLPYAGFQVHWTLNQVMKHGAEFFLILGKWGDGTSASDRFAVAAHLFVEPSQKGFMIVDASSTAISRHSLVGKALNRADVIGTPLAKEVFTLIDEIWAQDERIGELVKSYRAANNPLEPTA